jgi:hypothetical protein
MGLYELEVETAAGRRAPRPGEPGWERVGPFLDRYTGLLAAVNEGSRRPGLGLPLRFAWQIGEANADILLGPDRRPFAAPQSRQEVLEREWIIGALLPHLQHMRTRGRLRRRGHGPLRFSMRQMFSIRSALSIALVMS